MTQFDDWIRHTLSPRDSGPAVRPGEIRRLVEQARRRRTVVRRRLAASGAAVIVLVGAYLIVAPSDTGSSSGQFEVTRMLDDGRLIIQEPLTGTGTIVKELEEIADWNRASDRTAAGEEEIIGYEFWRNQGRTYWTIGYEQVDDDGNVKTRSREPVSPAHNMNPKTMTRMLPFQDRFLAAVEAKTATRLPSERHFVEGKQVIFEVWTADFPEIGRVIYGRGAPPR